jgi:hypothetical protein
MNTVKKINKNLRDETIHKLILKTKQLEQRVDVLSAISIALIGIADLQPLPPKSEKAIKLTEDSFLLDGKLYKKAS